jgi:hypothetical protein
MAWSGSVRALRSKSNCSRLVELTMQLVNKTPMVAAFTLAFEPDGRELLVVAIKGSYALPTDSGGEPALSEDQLPLVDADEFTGEPGLSAPLYETDFAPRKPRCDVLLNGTAYAPAGRPSERVNVSLRVGKMAKAFDVVGPRAWRANLMTVSTTRPERFTKQSISYDVAFGGVDRTDPDPAKHRWFAPNHAGMGYCESSKARDLELRPPPHTEEAGRPVVSPRGHCRPMAFGAIGRAWAPRYELAGTYDKDWLDQRAPFWPDDLDWRYFQAAPPDQQTDHIVGGEEVVLVNLTATGLQRFTLPRVDLPVLLVHRQGKDIVAQPLADTLVLEPESNRFTITWRVSHPLRRSIFDLQEVVVGERRRTDPLWVKRRYAGLAEYIRSRPHVATRPPQS